MPKSSHNSTIRSIVEDRNASAPRVAAQKLANMVALAERENVENRAPWDGDSPVGGESTWMIVRLLCAEYEIPVQEIIREARDTAGRAYVEIKDEAYEIDQHDRFAVPDENKVRATDALIELIEG